MFKNNTLSKLFRFTVIYMIAVGVSLLLNLFIDHHIGSDTNKIVISTLYIGGVYILFNYFFILVKKIAPESLIYIFLILLLLKSIFIFAFIMLFLDPMDEEHKKETLLFFKTYFVLLVTDLAIKVRLLNQ